MAIAQKIRAKHYLERSAKSGEGVREVFRYVTGATLLSQASLDGHRGTELVIAVLLPALLI